MKHKTMKQHTVVAPWGEEVQLSRNALHILQNLHPKTTRTREAFIALVEAGGLADRRGCGRAFECELAEMVGARWVPAVAGHWQRPTSAQP